MTGLAIRQPAAITSAADDDHIVDLWLRKQRNEQTRESYARTVADFRNYYGRELRTLKLDDLLAYADHLTRQHGNASTQARKLATVKSLLTFAQTVGYTAFNVGRAVALPKVKDTRAERILSEEDVFRLFAAAEIPRDALVEDDDGRGRGRGVQRANLFDGSRRPAIRQVYGDGEKLGRSF